MSDFGSRGRGRGGSRGRGRGGHPNSAGSSEVHYYGNQARQQQRPISGQGPSHQQQPQQRSQPEQQLMPASEQYRKLVSQKLAPSGTEGEKISLIGNFYKMTHSDVTVFHYDVAINKTKKENQRDKHPSKESSAKQFDYKQGEEKEKLKSKKGAQQGNTEAVVLDETEKLDDEMSTSFQRFLKKFAPLIVDQLVMEQPKIFQKDIHYVYDGLKNLYTAKALSFPEESAASKELQQQLDQEAAGSSSKKNKKKKPHRLVRKVSITIDSKKVDFVVEITLADRVFLAEALQYYQGKTENVISERVISVFEIIFGFVFGKSFTSYQRKFFNMDDWEGIYGSDRMNSNAERCRLVHGFINSVRMTEFGLALNVHLKTTCIISASFDRLDGLVLKVIGKTPKELERGEYKFDELKDVNRIIHHLKIFTNHRKNQQGAVKNKLSYTVDCLDCEKKPYKFGFKDKDKELITIAKYFENEYKIVLKDFPLVKTTGKKPKYLPLELCLLVEKQFWNNSKIDNDTQKELLIKSTQTPDIYFNRLKRIVQRIADLDRPLQSQFGLGMQLKPVNFQGRVLPPPRQINAQRKDPFCLAKKANNWALLCFDQPVHYSTVSMTEVHNFIKEMVREGKTFGMEFAEPRKVRVVNISKIGQVEDELKTFMSDLKGLELIFVGIPKKHSGIRNTTDLYQLVKHYFDQVYGVVSQCFKSQNLAKIPRGYFDNFLLKVNGKIGGKNNVIDSTTFAMLMPALAQPTMVVGVDVNHPGETERVLSSVSAAVGSYDREFSKYSASIRVQEKGGDEIVKQLDVMMLELLQHFAKENQGRYPNNLIVFRDGVSEGQLEKVRKTEIPLIRAAISKTSKGMKLVVIVVQKRHHTRFVRAQAKVQPHRPNCPILNVPSGTVVDQTIVEPIYKMFYLNSHFSQLGTSKPTKYIILEDELKFSADNIQKFCYYSCHTCIRTRQVNSIPTAVRYADLCAYRSKQHIEAKRLYSKQPTVAASSRSGEGSSKPKSDTSHEDTVKEEKAAINQLNEDIKVKEKLHKLLYFC